VDNKQNTAAPNRPPQADPNQQRRDILVVGGSAGALDAMLEIARGLPADFPGYVFIVSHIGNNLSYLPELLMRAGPLRAVHPESGEAIQPGVIYVAPPDRHMLLTRRHIQLSRGPRQHFTRPAIDPLFRTAAEAFGARVIGIVLSGTGSDGAAGLERIKRAGGLAIVQDPATSLYPEMPLSASNVFAVDHIAPPQDIPGLLRRSLFERVVPSGQPVAKSTSKAMDELEQPVALTCPECGGALRDVEGTTVKQYRCHLGHAFGAEEVAAGQAEKVENAIGVAIRVLNERVELCRQMGKNASDAGRTMGVSYWQRLQHEAEEQLAVLRGFLMQQPRSRQDSSPPASEPSSDH
jgi:two-component system chemotaxis response regulator CheB